MVKDRVINTLASMFNPKPKELPMTDDQPAEEQLEMDLNPIADDVDDPVTENDNTDILSALE